MCVFVCAFVLGRVVGLKEGDWSNLRIARRLDRSEATIKRCEQESVKHGRAHNKEGNGYKDH